MSFKLVVILGIAILCAAVAHAGEIGYIERFSLADDRSVPLKELIPGTEDYYYFHCLHFQNQGEFAKVDEMLAPWIKRYNYTGRVEEIRNRQALLTFKNNPAKTFDFVTQRLNLRFDHQKQQMTQPGQHPQALAAQLVARTTLTQQALNEYNDFSGFEDCGIDALLGQNFDPDRRRFLLQRLTRPDSPRLVDLVVADLQHEHSGGFGSINIHRQLTLAQLEECRTKLPNLINDTNWIQAVLIRLQPDADIEWRYDPQERGAYLDRLWAFANPLPPHQNSLKAHILYQRLVHDRAIGVFDKERFMTYLKLPRATSYMNPEYLRRRDLREVHADLHADFRAGTMFPPIGNDESLVRECLQSLLVQANGPDEFSTLIETNYLKRLFAETKLLNGVGNMEQWFAWLSPESVQQLKDRIDIEFLPTNKELVANKEVVGLDVAVKNVPTLIIKVYRLNTVSYYREQNKEITTAIDLDGLVANDERTVTYAQPPVRRHVERFEFPQIDRPGVYVVELIGNGKSSRALVRKGTLNYTSRPGSAGQVLTVTDGDGNALTDASVWLAGREYRPDASGSISIPYSNRPGSANIIIERNGFAVLQPFQHLGENYRLAAGFVADREGLLENRSAKVLVRPVLTLNGVPVDIKLLGEAVFEIATVDRDGIGATKELRNLEFKNDGETVVEFKTPERLARISLSLKGKVDNLSQGKKVDLQTSTTLDMNGIDKSDKVEDLHLRHSAGAWSIELFGKTGEPKANRPINVELKHREFRRTVHATLQTNEKGRVDLGALADIAWVKAVGPEGTTRTWPLWTDRLTTPSAIHVSVGEPILVPCMIEPDSKLRDLCSLLETRANAYTADFTERVKASDGFLEISDIPAGDYELWIKPSQTAVKIRVTRGKKVGRHYVSRDRYLQAAPREPVQIRTIDTTGNADVVKIRIGHPNAGTRVHVVATRFHPTADPFARLCAPGYPEPGVVRVGPPVSLYVSGRNIGDEYRYILERKYSKILAGNMLRRPSLLLNPWSLRKTDTGTDQAQAGDNYNALAPGAMRDEAGAVPECEPMEPEGASDGFSSLDFLADPALVIANLEPGEDGTVTVERKLLGNRQQLHVFAVDPGNTVYRQAALPDVAATPKDLRLLHPLEADKHYTEQRNITTLAASQALTINDITTAKMEAYDSLAGVYSLFVTLSHDATLTEFSFVTTWPELSVEKKRELYSKYACHELSFFLYKKDPEFFGAVIKPYLVNKKDKTFLDHWLLGNDLSEYLKPWAFGRLNIVERILLAQRINGEGPQMARHTKDLFDLLPIDTDKQNDLFNTALKGSALETGDRFGFEAKKSAALAAKPVPRPSMARPMAPPPPPPPSVMPTGGAKMDDSEMDSFDAPADEGMAASEIAAAPMQQKAAGKLAKRAGRADLEMKSRTRGLAADMKEMEEDTLRRKQVRQLYRALEKTEEWVENNYYKLPIERHVAGLITINGFWSDYAAAPCDKPFLSNRVAEASRNFPEMMFALAVLDLPFAPASFTADYGETKLAWAPSRGAIVFHKEIKPAEQTTKAQTLLVGQNFFANDDRYRNEGNERFDKFVTEEFLPARVYGCQVVLTNPTSSRKKVDVLLQIPHGAIPVLNGFYTRSVHRQIEPYSTQTIEYFFYFPKAGQFGHFPVHVAQNEQLIACSDPFVFNVVEALTKIDTTSWQHISQNGSEKDVLNYLENNNIDRLDLTLMAWRLRNRNFFDQAIALLTKRHVYRDVIWSYAMHHQDVNTAREYLAHSPFTTQVGSNIASELLNVDPVTRFTYQHREYWPLVNARAYQLGKNRKILNQQFSEQYNKLLIDLSYRRALTDADRLAVTYYMVLQDRIEEAQRFFAALKDAGLVSTLQYDYMKAWLAFSAEQPAVALDVARKYLDHPVDRWRKLFQDVAAQAEEITGKGPKVIDKDDRDQQQVQLAATEPNLSFKVENRVITLRYQNLSKCRINYYLMDIELLFSRNPFVQEVTGQFSAIEPNESTVVELPAGQASLTIDLPTGLRDRNVMIEITSGGVTRSQAYYPNSLGIDVLENYGQVRLAHERTHEPLAKVYVKVYARMKDKEVRFYKDGYTDLRGRFDYASLSTNDLDNVERFSILMMSDQYGAVVREAAPPKQ